MNFTGSNGRPRRKSVTELEKVLCKDSADRLLLRTQILIERLEEIGSVKDVVCAAFPWPVPWIALIEVVYIGISIPTTSEAKSSCVK